MREWIGLALAATLIACSGGSDPVHTIGGDGQHEPPGLSDYPGSIDDHGSPTTEVSTLVALCTKACAHVHAKGCEGAPVDATSSCELQCASESAGFSPSCADENAAVYACTSKAEITCAGGIMDEPVITGCEDETSELQKCAAPGSDCVILPSSDECFGFGFKSLLFCSQGITPPKECIQISIEEFCCP